MVDDSKNIIIEFAQVGNLVKVTAICPITYAEAFIVGDPNASREYLMNLATRRLESVIKRKNIKPADKDNDFYA